MATDGLWGWFAFVEMLVFVLILALGLAWAWAKGMLDWVKPAPAVENVQSPVPQQLYEQVNTRVAAQGAKLQQKKD